MRTAEITLLTILYLAITILSGALIEKEYNITVTIQKTLETNSTVESK